MGNKDFLGVWPSWTDKERYGDQRNKNNERNWKNSQSMYSPQDDGEVDEGVRVKMPTT